MTPAARAAIRWLLEHEDGVVDRHTLFAYYDERGLPTWGLATVSRRGAAGRMASLLESAGHARDGRITAEAAEAARG